jgi:AcrR family transcriptional regulator
MMPLDLGQGEPAAAPKLGRPLDASRDADILNAALDVLSEAGYDGMTVDMVAARAKAGKATLYRRWPSKTELVVDAVACMKQSDIDYSNLPDTGTLRGDLVAMIRPPSIQENEKKLKVMAGVVSLLARNPELADAVNQAIVAPRMKLNLFFMKRAIERGEIPADTDIHTLALISPSMVSYQTLMLQKPVDREFLLRIIDCVVLPAAGIRTDDLADSLRA